MKRLHPLILRRFGFALFAISFVTPSWDIGLSNLDGKVFGYIAFLLVPQLVWQNLMDREALIDLQSLVLNACLCLGWLANFSIFSSLPRFLAFTAIAAPWLLFGAFITLWDSSIGVRFIPFYPWAIGIGIIHCSRLISRRYKMAESRPLEKP
jgi:hypothetical protein